MLGPCDKTFLGFAILALGNRIPDGMASEYLIRGSG